MKMVNDILKVKGKYSMKRITAFTTFLFVLILGTFIVISDKVLKTVINPYGIQVFNSLLLFLTTLMGITEFSKKLIDKEEVQ